MLLIGIVLGLVVGISSFPNVILPVVWSWPRARRLERQGKLTRRIPLRLLLLAPLMWGTAAVVAQLVVVAVAPNLALGYGVGQWLAFFKTLWMLVSRSDRAMLEEAFNSQWRDYIRQTQPV